MADEQEQRWSWAPWCATLKARPWLVALLALDILLLLIVLSRWGGPTLVVGTLAALVALGQLQVAWQRHQEQTKADIQRRITESFIKAVELLGSEKLQVRLGGVYTLERIARESELDYWPIMETLEMVPIRRTV